MGTEQDILRLDDSRYRAMCARDMAALERLTHPELVYGHSSGRMDNAASWLESMRSGAVRYRSARPTEQRVRLYGDTALITGRADLDVEIGGQAKTLRLNLLAVWTRTQDGWKFVGWQSTPIPQ